MIFMVDYRALYYKMFASAADAVEALENQNFGDAKTILISAMQAAEESVISSDDSCQITLLPPRKQ